MVNDPHEGLLTLAKSPKELRQERKQAERARRTGRLVTHEMVETHPAMAADLLRTEPIRGTHKDVMRELMQFKPKKKGKRS